MGQNKEQLEKLLKFIKKLVDEPGNEDFSIKLKNMLGVTFPPKEIENSRVDEIEKYLGLDYRLDSASPIIDYTFIDDEFIRNQLVSDFREMLRYRFGVRSHKIDFSEFCRYAILQAEQLLDYFYKTHFASVEEIADFINSNVSWAKTTNLESVSALSLAIKLSAVTKVLNKKYRETLDYAREVRNEQSHRGKDATGKDIRAFKDKLTELGLPLTREGEVYWNGIKDNKELVEKYSNLSKSDYWKYRFQLWYSREPFDEVLCAIEELSSYVKESLSVKSNK